ncbi:MAG: hypothetical protein LH468_10905 [Nocardioides sp.]|nr:hypothetical protein [Nocardioides sp.]
MRTPKITPSLLISLLALVIALGGTSYAAAKINGKNIQNKSISASKIVKNTLGSNRIKDGKVKAKDLAPGVVKNARWLLVNPDGTIKAQSGGFTLVANYPTLPETAPGVGNELRANGNVYINAGDDLSDNGITASVVLQNTVDQDGGAAIGRTDGPDANAEFSGEIAVSRCNVGAPTTPASGPTNCAPAAAQNATSFVVSPRNSDGTVTDAAHRKAFYVIVTG